MNSELFTKVTGVVVQALEIDHEYSALQPETSLMELGLDSLKAVDLAVALEEALGITEFPIQEWADAEGLRDEPRFTIGSLVGTCGALLEASGEQVIR
jgi:acyl carrier protein